MSTDLKVFFVLPSKYEHELETSEQTQQAFELCRQNQMVPEWISEEECVIKKFGKKDVIVFENFEGVTFLKLKSMECLSLVGPRCVMSCLLEGIQVPNNKSPVFNMAMHNLVVTASNYSIELKKEIKKKVEMMGGIFSLHLGSDVTHLVTDSVRTEKYMLANENNVSILLYSWIEDVWETNITQNVKATSDIFQKHKCPVFNNLQICCSGFEKPEREKLEKLIHKNGGTLKGKLLTISTDVLICKGGVKSLKFNAAKKSEIPCLTIEWIYKSIEKGYAIPEADFVVDIATPTSSTPTKSGALLNPDFSMMSVISGSGTDQNDDKRTVFDATTDSLYLMTPQHKKITETQKEYILPNVIDNIDMKQVKEAGTFLDGCGIYIAGFNSEKRDKLCRILKSSGATRYDDVTDRVTHIVIGDIHCPEVKLLNVKEYQIPMVHSEWLLECIKQKQPVHEELFIITSNTKAELSAPSSPLSKKGLTLLQNDSLPESITLQTEEKETFQDGIKQYFPKTNTVNTDDEDTLAQLLAQGKINSKISDVTRTTKSNSDHRNTTKYTSDSQSLEETEYDNIFKGLIFRITGVDDENKYSEIIEKMGGKIAPVSFKGIIDCAVVPIICNQICETAVDTVNYLWIMNCCQHNEIVEMKYYHSPIYVQSRNEPLSGCIITISGYAGFERSYLINLIQYLGGTYQDKLARVSSAIKGVAASTHLISLQTSGPKYLAAKKWKLPTVTPMWIIQCATTDTKLDEKPFLLNASSGLDTTASSSNSTTNQKEIRAKTPVLSNKRDSDDKRVSPDAKEEENEILMASRKKFKFVKELEKDSEKLSDDMSPFKGFPSQANNSVFLETPSTSERPKTPEGDLYLEVEGRIVLLSEWKKELIEQGIFDTPSPIPQLPGTPFDECLARFRREGQFQYKNDSKTANSNNRNPSPTPGSSQGTPVSKYIRGLQEHNILPSSPKNVTPLKSVSNNEPWLSMKTPDTPYGIVFGIDNPSPGMRKRWKYYLDHIPEFYKSPSIPSWSELIRKAWPWVLQEEEKNIAQPNFDETENGEEVETTQLNETPSHRELNNKFDKLKNMLKDEGNRISFARSNTLLRIDSSSSSGSILVDQVVEEEVSDASNEKGSQAYTVGWDEPIESSALQDQMTIESSKQQICRKFMISGLDQSIRTSCCTTIKSFGGDVSELTYYDPTATHLICSNPTRNEKILSCMAAGKWVIHYSYIQSSAEAGRFLNEELFEFGNKKSEANLKNGAVEASSMTECIYWWRLHVLKEGQGAFKEMRALVFSKNKEAVIRLIEAGGGVIVNASPPFDHSMDVTHCFIDLKLNLNISDFIPLAQQGVLCLNVLYLSGYLTNKTDVDETDFIISQLQAYY